MQQGEREVVHNPAGRPSQDCGCETTMLEASQLTSTRYYTAGSLGIALTMLLSCRSYTGDVGAKTATGKSLDGR